MRTMSYSESSINVAGAIRGTPGFRNRVSARGPSTGSLSVAALLTQNTPSSGGTPGANLGRWPRTEKVRVLTPTAEKLRHCRGTGRSTQQVSRRHRWRDRIADLFQDTAATSGEEPFLWKALDRRDQLRPYRLHVN